MYCNDLAGYLINRSMLMVTMVELDWLFSEVELGQLELGNNNNVINYDDTFPQSQVYTANQYYQVFHG